MQKDSKKSVKKDQEYVQILGIDLYGTQRAELLTAINNKITHNNKFSVLTPNPELLLAAQKDGQLISIINSADFLLPDGIALLSAANFLTGQPVSSAKETATQTLLRFVKEFYFKPFSGQNLKSRLTLIKGREFFGDLVNLAHKNNWRIFLLGGDGAEARLTAGKLGIKYPGLKVGFAIGPKLDQKGKPVSQVDIKSHLDVVKRINSFKPHLLFVAFGNPKQEYWIGQNLPSLKVSCAMAVGGTFRYEAGLSKLPPEWLEKAGLEWLWRLLTEPYRLKRVLSAVFVFPLKVLRSTAV